MTSALTGNGSMSFSNGLRNVTHRMGKQLFKSISVFSANQDLMHEHHSVITANQILMACVVTVTVLFDPNTQAFGTYTR